MKEATIEWNDDTFVGTNPDNTSVTAKLVIDCRCELGEGIIYDASNKTVVWTDILHKQFHSLSLIEVDKKLLHRVYDLPKMLGSFGLLTNATYDYTSSSPTIPVLCAWEDGFQLYDVASGKELSEMSVGESVNPVGLPSRLNDGRTDPNGNYYICGGYHGSLEDVKMKVYKCEQQNIENPKLLLHTPIVPAITTTNSICWSIDGTRMYLADSPTKTINVYPYDATTGTINLEQKQFVHTKPRDQVDVPDGSCVDSEGYIWNAVWKHGKGQSYVQRIDPINGNVVYTIHIPNGTSQITCCCFGGNDLNILFITSAAESTDFTKEPNAGALYAVHLPFVTGRPESRLQFQL